MQKIDRKASPTENMVHIPKLKLHPQDSFATFKSLSK